MKIVRGDLLKLGAEGQFDVIVHGANCQCVMCAGIAKAIRDVFPEAYEADRRTPKADRSKLGTISFAQVWRDGRPLWVVNAWVVVWVPGCQRRGHQGDARNELCLNRLFALPRLAQCHYKAWTRIGVRRRTVEAQSTLRCGGSWDPPLRPKRAHPHDHFHAPAQRARGACPLAGEVQLGSAALLARVVEPLPRLAEFASVVSTGDDAPASSFSCAR